MSNEDAYKIAMLVIGSIGGGGAIVLSMSSWLGKIWADRLMLKESAKYQNDLSEFQAKLRQKVDGELADSKNNLEIFKEKHLKGHNDKIAIYRLATDVIVEVLGDLDYFYIFKAPVDDGKKRIDVMNRGRMRAYAYLAMLAPQEVLNGLDNLFDHLILVIHGKQEYQWPKVRELTLVLLNEIRKDIGLDSSPISYFGKL